MSLADAVNSKRCQRAQRPAFDVVWVSSKCRYTSYESSASAGGRSVVDLDAPAESLKQVMADMGNIIKPMGKIVHSHLPDQLQTADAGFFTDMQEFKNAWQQMSTQATLANIDNK